MASTTPNGDGDLLRFVPALDVLRGYTRADARADLFAGVTVAAVAVPQAMAYAMAAGLPAQYGLYTAIIMTAVGGLFTSSRQLINGPTNAISIAVLSVVSIAPGIDDKIAAAVLLAFMVGAIQLLITIARLGDLSRYISHSVIVGFMLGAAVLLVLDQAKNFFGLVAQGGDAPFIYRLMMTLARGGPVHAATAGVGLASVALLLALRGLKIRFGLRLLPELLVTVIVMAALVAGLGLDARGVAVVGAIPSELPRPSLPDFDYELMRNLSGGALAIAILGLLEAIAMSKMIAAQTRQKLDVNQQCLSEGLANITGGLFQCIPGSGSLTRSAINQQAGAASQWAGIVSAGVVALIMVAFAPYAQFIPRATLAGILVVSAWRMIDWSALVYHVRITNFDAAIVGATAFSAVFISIEVCVLIGVVMSFALTVRRAGRIRLTEFVVAPDGAIRERLPEDARCKRLLIYGLDGELFFGASAALEQHFATIERALGENARALVLRLKRARNADAVAISMLEGFVARVQARGVPVFVCGISEDLERKFVITPLGGLLRGRLFREERVRPTSTVLAVRSAYAIIGEPCRTCPRVDASRADPSLYYAV